jgi:chemotaxis protein methyltransferase CheR
MGTTIAFFEEKEHLRYLVRTALPELIRSHGYGVKRELMVWSAGCRSGEEPYTLAMVLTEFACRYPGLGFHFLIIATEASPYELEKARQGIYEESSIAPIPPPLRKKYLLKSVDRTRRLVRIAPEVRDLVRFRKAPPDGEDFRFREPIDVIFCRDDSVFARSREEDTLSCFHSHLSLGGFMFLRNSTLSHDLHAPLALVAPRVYKKVTTSS